MCAPLTLQPSGNFTNFFSVNGGIKVGDGNSTANLYEQTQGQLPMGKINITQVNSNVILINFPLKLAYLSTGDFNSHSLSYMSSNKIIYSTVKRY